MKFEDIYQFFDDPPPTYLNRELAVCYVLDALLEEESYGMALINRLSEQFPQYKLKGRGRPRKMYEIVPEKQAQAQELANLWRNYARRQSH